MSKLGDLLLDDMPEPPILPTGTWLAKVISGELTEEKEDKNGDLYEMARLLLKPVSPAFDDDASDVDPNELEVFEAARNSYDETIIFFSKYCKSEREGDYRNMGNILKAAGADTKRHSLRDVLSNGVQGLQFFVEITHEVWEGKPRTRCNKVFAAD